LNLKINHSFVEECLINVRPTELSWCVCEAYNEVVNVNETLREHSCPLPNVAKSAPLRHPMSVHCSDPSIIKS